MLTRDFAKVREMVWIVWAVSAATWLGCGGSTESTNPLAGAGGSVDTDASTGGSGGSEVDAGTGGTGQTGGTGGTQTGGTGGSTVPDGSVEPDTSLPDAMSDAVCGVFGEACDPAADDCCAPLACIQGSNGARCRLEPSDAGLDGALCMPPQQVCTQTPCCPGLECVDQGPTKVCHFTGLDGGMPEGGHPDAGTCHDLFEACGPGYGPCCGGLQCKTEPPSYPERQCLPAQWPDPADCPATEPTPQTACDEVGLQCAYGMMTVCTCYLSGWQCAY